MKKYTDTPIQQTKTKSQDPLEFKLNKHMDHFSFSTPMNLSDEGKGRLAVTIFEATTFNITDETNTFSVTTPERWIPDGGEELINKLNGLLELRSQNDIELHVKEVGKRSTRIELENSGYNLAGFDLFENEILAELSRVKCWDLEDLVFRMQITYDEFVDILDMKYNAGSTNRYALPPAIYKISHLCLILKSELPNELKVNIAINDIRLRSNLATNKSLKNLFSAQY